MEREENQETSPTLSSSFHVLFSHWSDIFHRALLSFFCFKLSSLYFDCNFFILSFAFHPLSLQIEGYHDFNFVHF